MQIDGCPRARTQSVDDPDGEIGKRMVDGKSEIHFQIPLYRF